MSGKTIATIYFYIISAASLALIIIGVFNTANFIINSTFYDQYTTRYSQPNCDSYPYKAMSYPVDGKIASSSAESLEMQKKSCLTQQDLDRKQHKIDDLKNAITFSLIGIILFSIHFPLARKQSHG